MEYYVCEAKSAKKLQRTVSSYLGAGRQLAGGVAVAQSQNTSNWWFYQALVRESAMSKPTPMIQAEPAKLPADGFGNFD